MSSTYLQAPLLLQISTNKNANQAWNISAGIVGGIRVDARQMQKWEADGKKNKDKTKDENKGKDKDKDKNKEKVIDKDHNIQ